MNLVQSLSPVRLTAALAPVTGRLRERPEDFRVIEVPAYPADGKPNGHLLVPLTKHRLTTQRAVELLLEHLSLPRAAVGVAGLKDRDAVTTQWVSVPASSAERLRTFVHESVQLGDAQPHSHKLRRGHLRGNQFVLVVRDLAVSPEEALLRLQQKVQRLNDAGGLPNYFGSQRLGEAASNVESGLKLLQRGEVRRRDHFALSSVQAAVFHRILTRRIESGQLRTVLVGDTLRKRATGGQFVCQVPAQDQPRLEAGEIEITAPLMGSKVAPSPAAGLGELERDALADLGLAPDAFHELGKNAPGTRRTLQVDVEVRAEAVEGGLRLRFALPAGSYATQLWGELNVGEEP